MKSSLTYIAPSGERVDRPTLEFLRTIVFDAPDKYWAVGNRNSTLQFTARRGREVILCNDKPALTFAFIKRHGFLLLHAHPQMRPQLAVPFAGGEDRPWAKHFDGQDVWYVPRACLVSRPFAWAVVEEFLKSQERSASVPWVDKFKLSFRLPAAGDAVPKGADLAR